MFASVEAVYRRRSSDHYCWRVAWSEDYRRESVRTGVKEAIVFIVRALGDRHANAWINLMLADLRANNTGEQAPS